MIYASSILLGYFHVELCKVLHGFWTDDTNKIGTKYFPELEESTGRHFEQKCNTKLEEGEAHELNGANMDINNGVYSKSQTFHTKKRRKIQKDTEEINKPLSMSQRARGAYIASLTRAGLMPGFAIFPQRQDSTTEYVI